MVRLPVKTQGAFPMNTIMKYPRTHHVVGSRKQYGDDDLNSVSLEQFRDCHVVVEEKLDGANCAVSFSPEGEMLLQSRGHFLTGGYREKHFNLFKAWTAAKRDELFDALDVRYIMYGEWLYAKHTVFYTHLPHYFMEFDLYDKQEDVFLSTGKRRELLAQCPSVMSVPVLQACQGDAIGQLEDYVVQSLFISDNHMDVLRKVCGQHAVDADRSVVETDNSILAEGLYLKIEDEDTVLDRLKFVRSSFMTNILESETHWLDRPIIPNQLAKGVEIF